MPTLDMRSTLMVQRGDGRIESYVLNAPLSPQITSLETAVLMGLVLEPGEEVAVFLKIPYSLPYSARNELQFVRFENMETEGSETPTLQLKSVLDGSVYQTSNTVEIDSSAGGGTERLVLDSQYIEGFEQAEQGTVPHKIGDAIEWHDPDTGIRQISNVGDMFRGEVAFEFQTKRLLYRNNNGDYWTSSYMTEGTIPPDDERLPVSGRQVGKFLGFEQGTGDLAWLYPPTPEGNYAPGDGSGRLSSTGMRVVNAENILEPHGFEVVDQTGTTPYLHFLAENGAEFRLPLVQKAPDTGARLSAIQPSVVSMGVEGSFSNSMYSEAGSYDYTLSRPLTFDKIRFTSYNLRQLQVVSLPTLEVLAFGDLQSDGIGQYVNLNKTVTLESGSSFRLQIVSDQSNSSSLYGATQTGDGISSASENGITITGWNGSDNFNWAKVNYVIPHVQFILGALVPKTAVGPLDPVDFPVSTTTAAPNNSGFMVVDASTKSAKLYWKFSDGTSKEVSGGSGTTTVVNSNRARLIGVTSSTIQTFGFDRVSSGGFDGAVQNITFTANVSLGMDKIVIGPEGMAGRLIEVLVGGVVLGKGTLVTGTNNTAQASLDAVVQISEGETFVVRLTRSNATDVYIQQRSELPRGSTVANGKLTFVTSDTNSYAPAMQFILGSDIPKGVVGPLDPSDFPKVTSLSALLAGQTALYDNGTDPVKIVTRRLDGTIATSVNETEIASLKDRVTSLEARPISSGSGTSGPIYLKSDAGVGFYPSDRVASDAGNYRMLGPVLSTIDSVRNITQIQIPLRESQIEFHTNAVVWLYQLQYVNGNWVVLKTQTQTVVAGQTTLTYPGPFTVAAGESHAFVYGCVDGAWNSHIALFYGSSQAYTSPNQDVTSLWTDAVGPEKGSPWALNSGVNRHRAIIIDAGGVTKNVTGPLDPVDFPKVKGLADAPAKSGFMLVDDNAKTAKLFWKFSDASIKEIGTPDVYAASGLGSASAEQAVSMYGQIQVNATGKGFSLKGFTLEEVGSEAASLGKIYGVVIKDGVIIGIKAATYTQGSLSVVFDQPVILDKVTNGVPYSIMAGFSLQKEVSFKSYGTSVSNPPYATTPLVHSPGNLTGTYSVPATTQEIYLNSVTVTSGGGKVLPLKIRGTVTD